MRYLSWAVVLISVGFIGAWLVREEGIGLPNMAVDERSAWGTMAQTPDAADVPAPVALAMAYTQAWNSHEPDQVASFFAPNSVFTINDGEPYMGRGGIRWLVSARINNVPDLTLVMDFIEPEGDHLVYHWTLTGTHIGGQRIQISGTDTWRLDDSGLIAESRRHFDAGDYAAQIGGRRIN